ncbi:MULTISPECIES: metallophosphoesterase family protein [Stutzerimonas stutzeri subgroup]|uniref:Phosphoesterase n=2 Tax=Stutzerimonas stutzeri subgroup TaxID=578833 RepID=A0AA40RS86_STUST|nr:MULTISPECIES: metallophosphoesterase family protein [Stutzerimonas stutzeri group]CEG53666.1 putative Phosphoesterase [Stutzerimonas xanthomarina]HBW09524.1 metallophosphoesterase [Pseudomonas sp.]ESQ97256.1 phosphodiesterase [Stutzerimonas chloritidismutans AW-1]KJS69107.1 MAG: phosphodiesterase [[Pseudomonas] sp. BICA1-14]MBA1305060.1 metallophosphoesterase family protein [Stutzerimonas stutzeri]
MRIGLISDTHGLLRPEALAALQGCAQIIHAGDIGKPQVLDGLRAIAPLEAIRGNIDTADWALELPERLDLRIGGLTLHVLHDLKQMDIDPLAAGIDVVIAGHSHKPKVERRDGVLYINPGSAGPRRFSLPISLALLELNDGDAQVELISLS